MAKQVDLSDRVSTNRTKVDRYKWTVKDKPGTPIMINKHELQINHEYQRVLLPHKLDTATKVCPDCAAEGNPAPQPLDEFYVVKSPKYKNGQRVSAYCRRHTKVRNARAAREAPAGSGIRQSRERARAAWRTRNPERWKAIRRSWARRHAQATAKTYSAWVKANKTKRQASQQAWYTKRRKQRTPEQ